MIFNGFLKAIGLAAMATLLFGTGTVAQQHPLAKRLDSFFIVKEPAQRIAIYETSLQTFPDTGRSQLWYNSARSVIATDFAEAGNIKMAETWMSQVNDDRYYLRTVIKVSDALFQRGNTAYAEAHMRPIADSLYELFTTANKEGVNLNDLLSTYVPMLIAQQQPERIVHYLQPVYEKYGRMIPSDRRSVALTAKEAYKLENNLTVQYAKALAATGNTKEAINVLSLLQSSGLYNREALKAMIDQYGASLNGDYADAISDSLDAVNQERLASFTRYKKDREGKTVDFKSMHAKYVLLDFWGSWCHPCRMSHPHLKEIYAKYKSQGFEVIGIARESGKDTAVQRATWIKAIEEDGLPWRQVLNNENQQQFDLVAAFRVSAFPTKILLDDQGNIVATFIGNGQGGKDLEKKLEELFKP